MTEEQIQEEVKKILRRVSEAVDVHIEKGRKPEIEYYEENIVKFAQEICQLDKGGCETSYRCPYCIDFPCEKVYPKTPNQPIRILKELHEFVANRGAGAQYALESNAYSVVLDKIEEMEKLFNQPDQPTYTLNCEKCGTPFESSKGFPKLQWCPKCQPIEEGELQTREKHQKLIVIYGGLADSLEVTIALDLMAKATKVQHAKDEAEHTAQLKKQAEEIFNWFRQYAVHGGSIPLDTVLEDLRVHSKYSRYLQQEAKKK